MRELRKRWDPMIMAKRYRGIGPCHRYFLRNLDGLNLACIECPVGSTGPFSLELWDVAAAAWVIHAEFPTLKKAKEVGRLLAGVALYKNI